MRSMLALLVLVPLLGVVLGSSSESSVKPPQVYVYTRNPVKVGEPNQLICHCMNFHPPLIELQLKKSGVEYKDCQQSDMTFGQDWSYHITTSIKFTPEDGVAYSCDVKHNDGPVKSHMLEPLM